MRTTRDSLFCKTFKGFELQKVHRPCWSLCRFAVHRLFYSSVFPIDNLSKLMVRGKKSLCVLAALCYFSTRAHAIVTKPSLFVPSIKESSSFVENRSLLVRGGSSSASPTSSKKKKSKKKKTGTSDTKASKASKKQINNAMKEKDAAEVLGDAIR